MGAANMMVVQGSPAIFVSERMEKSLMKTYNVELMKHTLFLKEDKMCSVKYAKATTIILQLLPVTLEMGICSY